MKTKGLIISLLGILGYFHPSIAQCSFDPEITGDFLLCPNQTGLLTTGNYDTIQWYKRFLTAAEAEPIPGATSSTLEIDAFNDPAYYFSVEVTQDGCTETSPEVLVDGYVFILPFVSHNMAGNENGFQICPGDTLLCTLELPYDTLIVWYQDGMPIPGADQPTLAVTEPGVYTVEGAPSLCPNFVQPLGVSIQVSFKEDCITAVPLPPEMSNNIKIGPNPVKDLLNIHNENRQPITGYKIWNAQGQILLMEEQLNAFDLALFLPNGSEGLLLIELVVEDQVLRKRILKF